MGAVFLAHDPLAGRQVALKLFGRFGGESEEVRQLFVRELRASGGLIHPNVAAIFDRGEINGQPFVTMEYVEGVTLESLCVSGSSVPLGVRLSLIDQLCQGLHYGQQRLAHSSRYQAQRSAGDARVGLEDRGLRDREARQPGPGPYDICRVAGLHVARTDSRQGRRRPQRHVRRWRRGVSASVILQAVRGRERGQDLASDAHGGAAAARSDGRGRAGACRCRLARAGQIARAALCRHGGHANRTARGYDEPQRARPAAATGAEGVRGTGHRDCRGGRVDGAGRGCRPHGHRHHGRARACGVHLEPDPARAGTPRRTAHGPAQPRSEHDGDPVRSDHESDHSGAARRTGHSPALRPVPRRPSGSSFRSAPSSAAPRPPAAITSARSSPSVVPLA